MDEKDWLQDMDYSTWTDEHQARLQKLIEDHQFIREAIYPAIKQNIDTARKKSAERFHQEHRIIEKHLEPGTPVMARDFRKTSKHDPEWIGPYHIHLVKPSGTYILIDDQGATIQRAISDLKVIPKPQSPQQETLDDEKIQESSFNVEKILRHKGKGASLCYLVKWEGYPDSDNSWVKPSDFVDTRIITDYWADLAQRAKDSASLPSRRTR
jgi:hypothetical protein